MTSKVPGAYYRRYDNHKTICWVLYDKNHVSIKKRTLYRADHIVYLRNRVDFQWADEYYYPTSTRDYLGQPITEGN